MFKPLFLLFKIAGLSPSGSKFDSYLSATSFAVASVLSSLAYRFYISLYLDTLQNIVFIVVTPFMFLSFLVPIAQAHFRKQLFFFINEGLTLAGSSAEASCYYSEVFQFSMLSVIIAFKFLEYFLAYLSLDQNVIILGVLYFSLVSSLQHTAVVRLLHSRFSQLNHRLRAVAARPQTSSLSRLRTDLRDRLREHALLRRTVKHINSYFAFNTLCGFFTSLVFLIVDMYSLLLDVRDRPQFSKLMVFNMIQTAVLLLYKIDVCHRCSDQVSISSHTSVGVSNRLGTH